MCIRDRPGGDRRHDRPEVAERPPGRARPTLEERVPAEDDLQVGRVEAARPRRMTRRVEDVQVDVADPKGVAIGQLTPGWGCLLYTSRCV